MGGSHYDFKRFSLNMTSAHAAEKSVTHNGLSEHYFSCLIGPDASVRFFLFLHVQPLTRPRRLKYWHFVLTPLSETISIPVPFVWESPPGILIRFQIDLKYCTTILDM